MTCCAACANIDRVATFALASPSGPIVVIQLQEEGEVCLLSAKREGRSSVFLVYVYMKLNFLSMTGYRKSNMVQKKSNFHCLSSNKNYLKNFLIVALINTALSQQSIQLAEQMRDFK